MIEAQISKNGECSTLDPLQYYIPQIYSIYVDSAYVYRVSPIECPRPRKCDM